MVIYDVFGGCFRNIQGESWIIPPESFGAGGERASAIHISLFISLSYVPSIYYKQLLARLLMLFLSALHCIAILSAMLGACASCRKSRLFVAHYQLSA